jgi:aquaporin Z
MKNYVTEFIGTFFLVLTVVLSVHFSTVANNPVVAGLAIGGVLMVMVYMGGPISGGHYNPGVSLGVAIRGKLGLGELIAYWISQAIGAVCAAFIGWVIIGKPENTGALTGMNVIPGLVAEFVFSFALVLTVLATATSVKSAGNSYFGLAIGFTVGVGVLAVGSISGAAFNSAVGLGVCVFGLSAWANIWIYVAANLLGGVLAAGIFRVVSPEDFTGAAG